MCSTSNLISLSGDVEAPGLTPTVAATGLLRTVWFPISGNLISHITPYCATHLVGTIPNKEHLVAIIDKCV